MQSLAEIYARHSTPSGVGDKGTLHSYIPIYETVLAPIRHTAQRVLEIGVAEGHSLRMWREYFPNATVIGVDRQPCPHSLNGCLFLRGDATSLATYDGLRSLDVVIDDGSHLLDHQLHSHAILWPLVRPGGLYVIEDIQQFDTVRSVFEGLDGDVEIYDFRATSGVADDVMVVIRRPIPIDRPI